MNRKNNSGVTRRVQILTLAAALIFPSLALADDIPMPHPRNDNMMKNTMARHAAAKMIHFNEVDGEPIWIISSK